MQVETYLQGVFSHRLDDDNTCIRRAYNPGPTIFKAAIHPIRESRQSNESIEDHEILQQYILW